MSATASRLRDVWLDGAWFTFAAACLAAMVFVRGAETIPYHLIYVSLTLVYGLRVWPTGQTLALVLAVALSTGAIFTWRYVEGTLDFQECSEVVLMPMIFLGQVWHARRRHAAQRQVEVLAAEQRDLLEREHEFLRDASHAIRTPITIARGYLDLITMRAQHDSIREDAGAVLHQLERLSRLASRLLAIEQMERPDALVRREVDVHVLIADIGRRWQTSVRRVWEVDTDSMPPQWLDVERIESAMDALIENAVKFTDETGTIRLSCRNVDHSCVIEVSDSGPGIPPEELPNVFNRFWHAWAPGTEPGCGLGLSLVRAVVEAHGGLVAAGNAAFGGAAFRLTFPLENSPVEMCEASV
jgi:signal transduction histidine kinase